MWDHTSGIEGLLTIHSACRGQFITFGYVQDRILYTCQNYVIAEFAPALPNPSGKDISLSFTACQTPTSCIQLVHFHAYSRSHRCRSFSGRLPASSEQANIALMSDPRFDVTKYFSGKPMTALVLQSVKEFCRFISQMGLLTWRSNLGRIDPSRFLSTMYIPWPCVLWRCLSGS
jgi:hypothetical protein